MNIFELITQDEIDEVPEDPQLAFTQLVHHAQMRLSNYTKDIDESNDWHLIEAAQHGFMNVTIGIAKAYQIEPFAALDVPSLDNNGNTSLIYRQYQADLDHYMAQLLVGNSIRGKRDSVLIAPKAKDKIRSYIHGLKLAIDEADFNETKRARLHEKLSQFEVALEKRRLSLMAVTKLAFVILAIPGSLWASYDVVTKLTANVLQVVGEAKSVDDENRQLPPTEPIVALLPPRKNSVENITKNEETSLSDAPNFDDDIPF